MTISKLKKVGDRVEVETPDGYTEHKKSGSTTYTAEFKYQTTDGRAIQKKKSFPKELIADFENGTRFTFSTIPGTRRSSCSRRRTPSGS